MRILVGARFAPSRELQKFLQAVTCCALLGRVAVHWRISLSVRLPVPFFSFRVCTSYEFCLPTWEVRNFGADEAIKGFF